MAATDKEKALDIFDSLIDHYNAKEAFRNLFVNYFSGSEALEVMDFIEDEL